MDIDCSIIIPVYNAEKTLINTVNSVKAINGVNIEIILVNDGSTDKSGDICTELHKSDNRIRVFNQENGGVSTARNLGLSYAKGKYIYFIDSDDIVYPGEFVKTLRYIDHTNVDLIITDYIENNTVAKCKTVVSAKLPYNLSLDTQFIRSEIFLRFYTNHTIGLSNIWNKIFKKQVINDYNLTFEINRTHGEDWKFVIDYLFHTKNIIATPNIIYCYNIDGSQVLSKYRKGLLKSVIGSIGIKDSIYENSIFTISEEERIRIKLEQFADILNFLKLAPTHTEIKALRKSARIHKLTQEIIFSPNKILKAQQYSRNMKLIALFLNLGWTKIAMKMSQRGF